ncbi:alanine racemase [Alkalihalobacillus xiaoxiensis]|uniref:Alanine racemase n=1 Tax=Shouchella xiaoxiensis TaxID=766895 RepID=A0ABS2SYX3_9BACI|nr:alanine racemase [Shouchella xiaoxiensis]
MKTTSYRHTFATVDLHAVESNAILFKESLSPGTQLIAVVKGDGYGHGALPVAKAALAGGATYLGVAILDEAIELRDAGITAPILVLGYSAPETLNEAASRDITVTIFDQEVRDALLKLAATSTHRVKVHLKTDTGMGRVGVLSTNELLELARPLAAHPTIEVEGVFTHFAEADNLDSSYTDEQFERFLAFTHALEDAGINVPLKHCCNSAGTLYHQEKHLDMVRVGISLYGLRPDSSLTFPLPLKQALKLYSRVAAVRTRPAGSSISYGRTHKLASERKVATLPIGYADGLSRALSNVGVVHMNDQEAPIIGRVCMDQTMIDVTDISEVSHGALVEFPIDVMAELTNTINYEIVCAISKRVPRIYQ